MAERSVDLRSSATKDVDIKPGVTSGTNLLNLPNELLEFIFEFAFSTNDVYSLSDLLTHAEHFASLPRHRVRHPRLTVSNAWYTSALRPFLRTATLNCSTQHPWLGVPGTMSAWVYSLHIKNMVNYKQLWVTSISCPLPTKGDYWTVWEDHLKTVLLSLPNLRSMELTRVSMTNMAGLRSQGSRLFCTRYMEKADWIDALVAHPRLQRFLAFSAVQKYSAMKRALKLTTYVQIRLMARNDPRGIARWTGGQEEFRRFRRELQSAQDRLHPHAMPLRSVATVMVRVLQLRGHQDAARLYARKVNESKETSLGTETPRGMLIAPVAVAA